MAEWIPEVKKEAPQPPPERKQLSPPSMMVRGLLDRQDLKGFVNAYIEHLRLHNNQLVSILAPAFKMESKDIFEFLRDVFNDNTKNQEWNVTNFFITIMNIGIAIEKSGPPVVYDLMLLTDNNTPSPIYNVAAMLSQPNQNPELNEIFMTKWNEMFKTETFVQPNTMMPSFMSKFSRETQFMIIALIVLLIVMGIGLSGYFFTKYNKGGEAGFGNITGNPTGNLTGAVADSVPPAKFEF